ncbi:MAG: hypothetical protein JNM66_27075 [Bryobacterales bacterium]|nr:hypothetical protein [Bryobacterales bacterium]
MQVEQRLPVVAKIGADGVGAVEFQETCKAWGGERAVGPTEEAALLVVGGMNTAGTGELAGVGRVDDKAEGARGDGEATSLEIESSEKKVEQFDG